MKQQTMPADRLEKQQPAVPTKASLLAF